MKKYLSVLMSMLLVIAFMPTFAALSLAVDSNDVIYKQDFDDPNFDTETFISEFITEDNSTKAVTTKSRETELGNGYFRLSNNVTNNNISNTRISHMFDLSSDATKRKIIMEYRFRYLKLTAGSGTLPTAGSYINTKGNAYDSTAFVDFRSGKSTAKQVFPDAKTANSAADGNETALTYKAGSVEPSTWGTITVLFDETNPQRTIYVNGGEGIVVGNDLNSAAINRYASKTEFKPAISVLLNRVSKQVDFDYINIYKVPETFTYTLSETDSRSAKVTFNTMPDPSSISASAFTVDGNAATAVTRVDGVSNTYIVEFDEVAAGNHVFDINGVYAAGEADKTISTSATNFNVTGAGLIPQPEYSKNYLYNYDFSDPNNLPPVSATYGSINFITDEDGNDIMRITGIENSTVSLDAPGRSGRPKVELKASAEEVQDKRVVVEFKYRSFGMTRSPMFEAIKFERNKPNSPCFVAYKDGVYPANATEDRSNRLVATENGVWHTVSVIYEGDQAVRRILVDGVSLAENVTADYNPNNAHYGTASGLGFNLFMTGYFWESTHFDFDYIRAYTVPDTFEAVPAEVNGVSTGSIVADFNNIPDISTLNAANITITDSNDEYVSSAYFKSFAGEERKYNLIFSERLQPNTTYKITFENVEDIDGNVIKPATYEFKTGEAEMEYIDLSIDDEIPEETVAKLYAANQLNEDIKVTLMIAAYTKEGAAEKMVKFNTAEVTIDKNTGNVIYSSPLIDVSDIEGDYTLKAFAWAGDSGMSPVLDCVSK